MDVGVSPTRFPSDTLFPTTNNIVEIINQSPGLAIVPVDTIVAGVNASDVARGVGYIVSDGNRAGETPTSTRSRFAGVRPKTATYDPNTRYEDVL